MLREFSRREEVLDITVTAGGEGARRHHFVPEEMRRLGVVVRAAQLVQAAEADDLGDLRIGVQAIEAVAFGRERHQQGVVREALRQLAETHLPGDRGHVSQHFIHAAVLAIEHFLKAARAKRRRRPYRSSWRSSPALRAPAGCRGSGAHRAVRPGSCAWCTRARRRSPLPARLSVSGATPSGNAVSQPPVFCWQVGELAHDVVDALREARIVRGLHTCRRRR